MSAIKFTHIENSKKEFGNLSVAVLAVINRGLGPDPKYGDISDREDLDLLKVYHCTYLSLGRGDSEEYCNLDDLKNLADIGHADLQSYSSGIEPKGMRCLLNTEKWRSTNPLLK